jgi:hypothetical protein
VNDPFLSSRRDSTTNAHEAPAPPEASPAMNQPASLPPSSKRFRRIYVVLGIVAVVAVASALILVFWALPSVGAAIPLSYNFSVGEEMNYNITTTTMSAIGENTSETATMSLGVVSFDGENYTVNETATLYSPFGPPISFTAMEKENKTGYITYLNGTAGLQQMYSTFSNIGSFNQKDEAREGEVWHIPANWTGPSYVFNGTFTYKFGHIQNITVPAGTYKAFSIDFSSSNLTMIFNAPANVSISENITVNGQMHLEYGTCRLIDLQLQESLSIQQGTQISTQNSSEEMQLVQHIKY